MDLSKLLSETTGVLMMGGQGRRMGYIDKSMLLHHGESFYSIAMKALEIFPQTIISTAKGRTIAFEHSSTVVTDEVSAGPLGGIYTALKCCNTPNIFVISCDMPRIHSDLIKAVLSAHIPANLSAMPRIGQKAQTLCALYSKELLPSLKNGIDKGDFCIIRAVEPLGVSFFDVNGTVFEKNLHNVNSPHDMSSLDV